MARAGVARAAQPLLAARPAAFESLSLRGAQPLARGGLDGPAATPTPAGQGGRPPAGPIIGLVLAFAASTVALGIAFGIRRRIDKIAGPPPDEEED